MYVVNVHRARTELSRLLARVEAGEDVVIARRGRPVARLVACAARSERRPDALKGRVAVPDTFFDPLPDEELAGVGGPVSGDRCCRTRTRSGGGSRTAGGCRLGRHGVRLGVTRLW